MTIRKAGPQNGSAFFQPTQEFALAGARDDRGYLTRLGFYLHGVAAGVHHRTLDGLQCRNAAAVDPEEAKAALNELNDYMVYDNFYCIPLVSAYTLLGMADGITNVQLVTQGDHAYYGMLRVE